MNTIIKRTWNQNRMVNIEDLRGMAFQAEDGGHTFEISGINDAGESVPLSGTVSGVFMRPDNADIAIVGSASGGVVSVTLPADCYAVNGRFALTIFVTSDSQKVAVYAAVGTVTRTSGGAVAGDTPQDVVDLINAINAAINSIPADLTNLMGAIAPTYSSSALYAKGAYTWYSGVLYKALVDISTAESFTAAHWETVSLADDVNELRTDLYGGDFSPAHWQDGMIYNHLESTNSTFKRTGEITLNKGETISFTGGKGTTALPINALTRVVNGAYQALKYYSGQTAETVTYTATVDMIVIVSTLKTLYGNDLVVEKTGTLENIQNEIDEIPAYVKNDVTATQFTLAFSGGVQYPITKGNTYIIKNNGTNTISLSTRTSIGGATIDLVIVAGGLSKQFEATDDASYIVCPTACDFEISSAKTLLPFIDSTLYKFGNYGLSLPLVRFDFNRTMGNYADDLFGIDFMANNGRWYSIMQTIYDKFDSLVSAYSNYVSKVDAAADVNLTYPAYANLNGEASGNYSPTPTYKTYMYKLVDNNSFVYSSRNPKKKLFLIGATHGNEIAGSFNLYLLAKNLCEATNSDYFKLRESFDVYIVPCLNGYGMCHYVRWNADGVDINRNYPISNWAESGEPYVIGYTGPSAASEFETQMIVALQNKYAFDVAIDHHNYGASSSQFYTEFWYERFNALANAALADCSSMFIENLPAYFGTNYRLFVDITNSTRPNVVLSDTMPCMAKWMYEQGLDFAATIEIGNQINYINGGLNTATDIPKYTNDVFKVGEFTLRNQLLYYCGFVLGGMV